MILQLLRSALRTGMQTRAFHQLIYRGKTVAVSPAQRRTGGAKAVLHLPCLGGERDGILDCAFRPRLAAITFRESANHFRLSGALTLSLAKTRLSGLRMIRAAFLTETKTVSKMLLQ